MFFVVHVRTLLRMENEALVGTRVTSPEDRLHEKGYLVLPRPFRGADVARVHGRVTEAFALFEAGQADAHRTLYEFVEDDDIDSDPRFREHGRAAIPRMEFKRRPGYKQLMMSLDFSTEFAELFAGGQEHQWRETHGPTNIKDTQSAFAAVLELFSTQAMQSIFAPAPKIPGSYCGFLLNDSAPFSVCFGYHYELHQDRHENAIVISVQLSRMATPWKIGRNLDDLESALQEPGAMMVMEAHDYEQRISPWHMPCIGEEPRNAAVVVFAGIYRDRFMDWLAEHATACGYKSS